LGWGRARGWRRLNAAALLLLLVWGLGTFSLAETVAPGTLPERIDFLKWSANPTAVLERGYRPAHVPAGFLPELELDRPRVALALSGGGARGLAHIGVLQVLQREASPVDIIVGTSMGAVVGGLYAVGYTPGEMEGIATSIDWGAMFSDAPSRRNLFLAQKETANRELLKLRFRNGRPYIPDALVTGERLFIEMLRLMRNAPYTHIDGPFDQNRIVLGAVATDLIEGTRHVFHEGDLPLALRGTMSVPIVFRPLRHEGMLLVDGGAVENIPTRTAREMGGDIVIAVDCATPAEPELDPDLPWEIANQVTTLMTAVNDSLSRDAADLAIIPNLASNNNTSFQNIREIIQAGRDAATAKLPLIRDLVGESGPSPELVVNVARVDISTNAPMRRPVVPEAYGLVAGETTTVQINRSLTRLMRELRLLGYGAATLKSRVSGDGTLHVDVDLGIVRVIRVEGVSGTQLPMVLRDVRVTRGQPLRTEDLISSLVQIHATGRYTTVYSTLRTHEQGGVILTFILEESPLPRVGFGIGFDSDRRSRYFGEFAFANPFPNLSQELVLRGRYGERDRLYGLYTSTDRLSRTYIGWQGQMEYAEREQHIYGLDGRRLREENVWTTRGQVNALFNMQTWGRVSAGFKVENVADKLDGGARERLYNSVVLRATLDTEDRRPFPTRGTLVDWEYESYIDPTDESHNFNRLTFHIESVVQVQERTVLRSAVRGGVAELTTPTTHKLTIGGLQSFPALPSYRYLATQMGGGTLEARYDLISRAVADAYLLARYDLIAFSDQKNWEPSRRDVVQSYALGFALDTLLGPMELWAGYSPVSSKGPEATRVAVNFGYRF